MLNIAIVEDEVGFQRQIQEYVERFMAKRGENAQITCFSDGQELLREYRPVFDVILLDIEMPQVNGMDAAEEIRRHDADVVIVFITNMAHYAIRGYSVGALDFLLKPVDYQTFELKFQRALNRVHSRESGQVLLSTADGMVRLDTRQIYYVEVQNRMLHYHTDQGEYVLRGTIQRAEQELAAYHFTRCNYWYLVNLRYVTEIRKDTVMVAGHELQVSRRNRSAFLTSLAEYVGGST